MYKTSEERYLYHYTSLSEFALILSSKKLRLFPLSNMDDLQEEKSREVKNYGRFIFISSWTEEKKESIPMWRMYSRPLEGVRIGLVENPFKVFDFAKGGFRELNDCEETLKNGLKVFCNVVSPFDSSMYGIRNPLYETQLVKVEYNDDKNLLFPNIINRNDKVILDGSQMGKMKNRYWEFQKEVRYRIITFIEDMDIEIMHSEDTNIESIIDKYIDRLPEFIDLHLSDIAIKKMKITVSPDFSESNRIILDSLIDKYAGGVRFENSSLTNIVR